MYNWAEMDRLAENMKKKQDSLEKSIVLDEKTFNLTVKAAYNSALRTMLSLHSLVNPKPKDDIYGCEPIPGTPGAEAEIVDDMVKITVPQVLPHTIKDYKLKGPLKRLWIDMITYACKKNKINKKFSKALCLIKIYSQGNSNWDVDNIMYKHVVDGIRHAGLIVDDTNKHLALMIAGFSDYHNPRTEVLVCDHNKVEKLLAEIGLF